MSRGTSIVNANPKPSIPPGHYLGFGRNAARPDVTRERHVWNLELFLDGLLGIGRGEALSSADRRAFDGTLRVARLASERLLIDRYPPEQIALGYRAAHGFVDLVAMQPDQRHQVDPAGARAIALTCFRADVGNMRRWNTLAERAPGVALDALLPPLPSLREPDRCQVIPFPQPARGETV
ncbi:hypothetical protein [Methylobacterium sp. Leaf87]|uniref:hypothetical protein n=1 Tax=Methylobacterium sp. Leaf87 TaxID=1736243 RepID=UPI0012E88A52|nr:hypothetical protein [Methylobacterium sp. Leaf87]